MRAAAATVSDANTAHVLAELKAKLPAAGQQASLTDFAAALLPKNCAQAFVILLDALPEGDRNQALSGAANGGIGPALTPVAASVEAGQNDHVTDAIRRSLAAVAAAPGAPAPAPAVAGQTVSTYVANLPANQHVTAFGALLHAVSDETPAAQALAIELMRPANVGVPWEWPWDA